ncbi:hypothetical protein GJU40_20185 [Bacillus lacus]|uniref:Uncharacterized protein n=1 Tax=Metabacillus lacus TaxID=1983721 RepID=A0A7X2M1I0_9BACI|nr:hypothetical protein [Metabacillus lacus]MRX74434.1 hypothetical protein [Metabacillus lacus]
MNKIRNGIIDFEGSVSSISPSLKLQEFKLSDLYSYVKEEVINEFPRYTLQPINYNGNMMNVTLMFNDNKEIFLVNMSKIKNQENSWDKWSNEHELQRKKEHDVMLEKLIGSSSSKFAWGEISSNYDPRSGSSMITIRYF